MPSGSSSKKSFKKGKTLGDFGKFVVVEPYGLGVLVITEPDLFQELCVMLTGVEEKQLAYADGLSVVLDHPEIGPLFVMLLPKKYEEEVVWHECLHIIHFLLELVGVDVDGGHSSSEVQAYSQGHLVGLVRAEVYPKPKRKKAPKKEA